MQLSHRSALAAALVALSSACGGGSSTSPSPSAQPPSAPLCTYDVSPSTAAFSATGGSGSVTVSTGATCSWSARSNASWITGLAASTNGTSNALLPYNVDANNTNAARTGTLTVATQTVTVTQSGATFLEVRGNYTLEIQAPAGCGWPVTTHRWPVSIRVESFLNGITAGTIVNLPFTPGQNVSGWTFQATPTHTFLFGLTAGIASGLTNGNGYEVALGDVGGDANGPTRATDGRGEIQTGVLHAGGGGGGNLTLTLWKSGFISNVWECFGGNWSLRIR